MDEIGFVIKCFFVSVFAVFCMQAKVGGTSVENHFTGYMRDAMATKWMRDIGGGATRVTASVYQKTMAQVGIGKSKVRGSLSGSTQQQMQEVQDSANRRHQELMNIEEQ